VDVDVFEVRKLRSGRAWSPRRLVLLALALVPLWVASQLVQPPSDPQRAICDLHGPCTAIFVRSGLELAGSIAGVVALILIAIAGVRWSNFRNRRRRHPAASPAVDQ
jgi:hypothetical protein